MSEDDVKPIYRYGVALLIIHPSMDSDEISHTLGQIGIDPYMMHTAGKVTRTPKGTEIGIATNTRWNAVYEFHDDERRFFEVVTQMVDKLHTHFKDFFRQIVLDGGRVELVVNLPGKHHNGSSMAPETLGKMADMLVTLGVEVFPKSNRFDD